MKNKLVNVYGDLNLDIIYLLEYDNIVFKDVSYVASRGLTSPGGVGGNVAVAIRRLGLESGVVASVGYDEIGRMLVEDLRLNRVSVNRVSSLRGVPTGVMSIIVKKNGERTIIGYRGANRYNVLSEETVEEIMDESRAIFAYGFATNNIDKGASLQLLIDKASKEHVETGLDLSGFTKSDLSILASLKKKVTYVFLNIDELEVLLGSRSITAAESLFKFLEPEALFLKMGGEGSMAISRERKVRMRALDIKPVDTTGSGDAFNAGVFYGMLEGFDIERALLIGNAMGAYKALGYGARHLPSSFNELIEFIEEHARGVYQL
ncbi:carbohydrate kinase family protein [Thermogladius sp. 4427co]|uniref:carbohydrate kinase family protein n=1 Tax=Thermogladius sp. 4427co TaxID=3450718 RepID=UPI003F7A81E1